MQNAQKFLIKTDSDHIYSLHILRASEYVPDKIVGLLLYYDDDNNFSNMRHRLLFENLVEAVKDKVVEYVNGRGENIVIVESPGIMA